MIVMFVMIVIIQGQFYQSPRHIKKRCIIDEAWRFLCEGSNPIAANFIEQGFRTARKHNGGFGVITQYLLDTDKTIQGQAIAASSDI
jgi:conjugal transfer ATP-binding protein TraC